MKEEIRTQIEIIIKRVNQAREALEKNDKKKALIDLNSLWAHASIAKRLCDE